MANIKTEGKEVKRAGEAFADVKAALDPSLIRWADAYDFVFWSALAFLIASRLTLILSFDVAPSSDMAWYYGRALELLANARYAEKGVATAYWPVGYPGFLAGVMASMGQTVRVGQLANLMLSVTGLVLMHRFCLQRFGDGRVAGVAAVLLAVYPNHMGYSVGLYSEPLYTFLLLVTVVFTPTGAGYGRFALMGLVLGLATLVKAQTMLLGPGLLFLLGLHNWSLGAIRSAFQRAALGTMFMAMAIAPWTWRNQVVMGAPVPVSTNGGMSLLAGNNPSMTSALNYDFNERDPIFQSVKFSVADQVAADQRARSAALGWIADNPGRFIALMPKKLFRLWAPDGESEWSFQAGYVGYEEQKIWFRAVRWLNQLLYIALLGGFAVGTARCLRLRDPSTLVVPVLLLFFTSLSMVFSGQSRYHAPLMPFVIAYAAWAFVRLWSTRKVH